MYGSWVKILGFPDIQKQTVYFNIQKISTGLLSNALAPAKGLSLYLCLLRDFALPKDFREIPVHAQWLQTRP
jgi:hypothetical protein